MALPESWSSGTLPTVVGSGVSVVAGGLGPDNEVLRFSQVSAEASAVRWDLGEFTPELDLAFRAYVKTPASWPSSSFNLIAFMNGTFGTVTTLTLSGAGAPGQVRLGRTGGSTVVASPSNTLSTDTWYRFELQMRGSSGQARVAVFAEEGLATPLWASTWETHANFEVPVRYVYVGAVNPSPLVATFEADDILVAALPANDEWLVPTTEPTEPEGAQSLQQRLTGLASAVGTDYKNLRAELMYGGLVNPSALHQWQAALGASSRYRASIVVVGDSISEGTGAGAFFSTYPSRLQTVLRAQKGIPGGPGYIAAARTATGLFLPPLPASATGTTEYMDKFGLGGRASRTGPLATDNVTYDAQICDRVRVWYSKAWLSAGLKIFIDDVDQGVTPDANAGSSAEEQGGLYWTSPVLTRGPHVVRITAANPDWPGYLEGVEFFDGDLGHGISVYNAGHFGYKTADFLTAPMERHWDSVRALSPSLGIIALGTNDLITAGMTGTVFANNLSSMIAKFPETSSILILFPPQRGSNQEPADTLLFNEMRAAARALATGRVAFLDMQDWWPTLTSDVADGQGLMFDTVHPNTAGMDTYAEVIREHIGYPFRRM